MDDFDAFWAAYPNRKGKKKARIAFAKALQAATFQEIMAGVYEYVEHKEAYRAWMHPTTYLNGEHWDDEYTAEVSDDQRLKAGLYAATVAREPLTSASGGRDEGGRAERHSGGSTLFGSGRPAAPSDNTIRNIVRFHASRKLGNAK